MATTSGGLGPPATVGGKRVVEVYLLDNSMKTLLVSEGAKVEEVVLMLVKKLSISTPEDFAPCFSLHVCRDGVTIDHPLNKDTVLVEEIDSWDKPSKLVFQVKLFMQSLRESMDPRVKYMLFIQGVYCVICGIYPVSLDEAVSLASLQVQAKFGTHDATKHKPGYLTGHLRGLIPASLLPRKAPSQWEADILSRHAMLNEEAKVDPQRMYLKILEVRDYYGCDFYRLKQTYSELLPPIICIGINNYGILLLKNEDKSLFEKYSMKEIFRWGFKPGETFYFEVKGKGGQQGPLYRYFTTQGKTMSDLLTAYAMQLLKERAIQKKQAELEAYHKQIEEKKQKTPVKAGVLGYAKSRPMMDELTAALKVQAFYRGYATRRDFLVREASTRIQALWRGYKQRCRFDEMLTALEEQYANGVVEEEEEETENWGEEYAEEEGEYAEEAYTEGEYAEGGYAEGEYAEGEGEYAEEGGEYAEGEGEDGEGEYAEDEYAEGAEGGYAEGEYAEGEYAEGDYAEGEYAEEEYAEGEYAEGEYAEGEYAEGEYAEGEYADEQTQGQSN